jgi:hypothetical protein
LECSIGPSRLEASARKTEAYSPMLRRAKHCLMRSRSSPTKSFNEGATSNIARGPSTPPPSPSLAFSTVEPVQPFVLTGRYRPPAVAPDVPEEVPLVGRKCAVPQEPVDCVSIAPPVPEHLSRLSSPSKRKRLRQGNSVPVLGSDFQKIV